ncbi:Cytochrome P450 [Venturia nashicola]|nr:Cytochrome P450 [Venturia nashicola]
MDRQSEANRVALFEDKRLNLGGGYFLLTGRSAGPTSDGQSFGNYFDNSFKNVLRGDQLARNFPNVLDDLRNRLNALAEDPTGITDPFKSVYEIVFQLTMRTLGCDEVANDPNLVEETMRLNRTMESVATPIAIMFPWFPSPDVIRNIYAGTKLYMIFDRVAKARRAEGRKEEDAIQALLDQGVVIGSLFAGHLNSRINAAWVLIYLAANPKWQQKVREEIDLVAGKYRVDSSVPLMEQLFSLAMKTWETEFSLIEVCLRDSIRLQQVGTFLRQNTSGHTVKIGDALVPDAAFVSYPVADIHHDPEVYQDPEKSGETPCLGMRFAKLEQVLITAFWLAMFEYQIVDKNGNDRDCKREYEGFLRTAPKSKYVFQIQVA